MDAFDSYEVMDFQPVNFRKESTTLCMAIRFTQDGKNFYAIKRRVELFENEDGEINQMFYGFVRTTVDKSLSENELKHVVVRYLAQHKLYLAGYSVKGRKCYVSYNSDGEKINGLQYGPVNSDEVILLEVFAQTESGVNYDDVFDMRIRGAVKTLEDDELCERGYVIKEFVSIDHDTLLSEDELPQGLKDVLSGKSDKFDNYYR